MNNHCLPTATSRYQCLAVDVFCLLLFVSLSGCQIAQSKFAQLANDAGGEFAAAATTLSYLHEGKLALPYARSSFEGFRATLDGLDQQLPSLAGRPNDKTISDLLTHYKRAIQAIDNPCLDTSCDWRAQRDVLNQASQAFLKAGEQ